MCCELYLAPSVVNGRYFDCIEPGNNIALFDQKTL